MNSYLNLSTHLDFFIVIYKSEQIHIWAAEPQQYLLYLDEQWQLYDLEEEKLQQVPDYLNS